jgi:hypothetical protein
VQFSAWSQSPASARHSVLDGWKALGGQLLLTPSQLSATSHGPAENRHTAVLFWSVGQVGLVPVQNSEMSQSPAEGRHSVVGSSTLSGGQVGLNPSQ